jgi:6-pyruvoyltetrahydropterin/6-carboxytetrahydropterin synthase
MLTIAKEFHFSASHVLHHLPTDHPCARLHGHNYVVVLELSAAREDLDEAGFVRDFGSLAVFKHWLDETLDHRHLNDVAEIGNPSAENIAVWVHDTWRPKFQELVAVRVAETPSAWAEYRPGPRQP